MQLGNENIGLMQELFIRHLVAYDKDTADGNDAELAESSDGWLSLCSAAISEGLTFSAPAL